MENTINTSNKQNKNRLDKNTIFTSLILSLSACYMICVFEPLQIYFTNTLDFWYDIYNLLPMCALLFLCGLIPCIALFSACLLINKRVWNFYTLVFGIVFLCTYIQGNFLASKLPTIDGNLNPWPHYDYQRKYSIILWLIVSSVLVIFVIVKKFELFTKILKYVSLIILFVLIITNISTCIIKKGLVDKADLKVTTDDLFEVSKEGKNFVIIMLDSIRGTEMEQILNEDASLRDYYKDFTYYADTMTGYPFTTYSLYYMMSGDWYEGDEYINDYRTNILFNASLFGELEKRDYLMDLYIIELPIIDNEGFYRFQNFIKQQSHFKSFKIFAKLELRLVGLKYAPYDLKKRCLALPNEIDDLRMYDEVDNLYEESNTSFVKMNRENDIDYSNKNTFKFIELDGAHVPYYFNENLESQEESGIQTDYSTEISASMKMVELYIDKYKEAGCYDNTVFVILSDHGYNPIPSDEFDATNPSKRQHGILFVKGINEHHDNMIISYAPIHHSDLPEAYSRLLNDKTEEDIFDYKEGDTRERRFLFNPEYNQYYFCEYIQTGDADNMETFKATGREYECEKGQVKGPK